MAPKALRMIRIEPHRPPDPLDSLLRAAKPGEYLALLHDDEIAVGVEAQGAFLMIDRLVVLIEVELERGENSMHVGVVVVQRQRDLQFIDDPLLERAPVVTPAVQPSLPAHARHPGVSMGVVWIEFDGVTERAKSLDVGLAVRLVVEDLAGQDVFVRSHIRRRLSLDAIVPCGLDATKQGRSDRRGDFVLDGEDILKLAIVALGPEMCLGLAVDELNSDPDPIPCLADASFGDVVHPELTRDLLGLDGLALVDEHGIAGDHEQLAEARQFGDDILSEPVDETLLLWVTAHIVERQNGDRGPFGARRWRV